MIEKRDKSIYGIIKQKDRCEWKDSVMLGMSGNGRGTRGRIEAERGKRAYCIPPTVIHVDRKTFPTVIYSTL